MKAAGSQRLPFFTSLVLGLVAGLGVGFLWARATVRAPAVEPEAEPVRLLSPPNLTATSNRNGAKRTAPLRRLIEWERHLAGLNPSDFPASMEAALRDETDFEKVERMAASWAERDPYGFLVWLRNRPDILTLRNTAYGVDLARSLVETVAREDLGRAWKIAGTLSRRTDFDRKESRRMAALAWVLRASPDRALAFVRAHREDVSGEGPDIDAWRPLAPSLTLPILRELLPGWARESILEQAIMHFIRADGTIDGAKAWFAGLSPDLRNQARTFIERGPLQASDPRRQAVLEAWRAMDSGNDNSKSSQPNVEGNGG